MTEAKWNGAPAVAFEALTVRYGKTWAVEAVSLKVEPGEVCALLGRNGSGKTSMIRCLLGHMKPWGGRAMLFGREAWKERRELAARVGVVPESADAPPELGADDICAFCAKLYPRWNERGVADRLARFKVPRKVPFGRLSKGQKNQVMLALALGHAPDLLVLDDPTLGLDVVARREFFEELVGELADRGTTVFLSTHDLSGVEGIATHVAILKEGHLLLMESLEALKERFRAVRWAGDRECPALADLEPVCVRRDAWGTEAIVSRFDEEAFARAAQTLSPAVPEAAPMPLEDIFIALAGEEGGRP